jgi:hypothetical protein
LELVIVRLAEGVIECWKREGDHQHGALLIYAVCIYGQ